MTHEVDVTLGTDQVFGVSPADEDRVAALRIAANAAHAAGRFAEAEQGWLDLLALRSDDCEAEAGVANARLNLDRTDAARPYWQRLLASPAFHQPSRIGLADTMLRLHFYDEGVTMLRSLLVAFPNESDLWNRIGSAEISSRRHAAALQSYRRAIQLEPSSAAAHCNLALAFLALDRLPEAVGACRHALALEPGSAAAQLNLSYALLAMGDLKAGFAAYEHRFAATNGGWLKTGIGALPWTGEPLGGRSILVVGEQANGDQFQFVRYLPELRRRGATVTFLTQPRLRRLFRSLGDDITLIDAIPDGSRFDVQCPLMSLPHHCASEGGRAPARTPYLFAEADRVARWGERIGPAGFRIGVAWEGYRAPSGHDHNRSFPLEALSVVARIPGVRLISLQMTAGLDQLATLPPGMAVETLGPEVDAGEDGFVDTAAIMMNLDLVITLDSGLAHLAGALGRPTWIALTQTPEWRWQRDRSDTPWYPTVRLFRQRILGDWDGVAQRMADAVRRVLPRADTVAERPSPPPAALPLVPVSCGEVLDKITILEIKVERLQPAAAEQAARELRHLGSASKGFGPLDEGVSAEVEALRRINRSLWDVEDHLRVHEDEGRFDEDFVRLARSVYALNDERALVKRRINTMLRSEITEQKSYGRASGAVSSGDSA